MVVGGGRWRLERGGRNAGWLFRLFFVALLYCASIRLGCWCGLFSLLLAQAYGVDMAWGINDVTYRYDGGLEKTKGIGGKHLVSAMYGYL